MARATPQDDLDQIVEAIAQTAKYGAICASVVRRVAENELERRPNVKQALKATKNKLHQIGGAYLAHRPDYAAWLERLQQAVTVDDRKRACYEMMGYHASTRERLAILESFYETLLGPIAPVRSVLDIACGLNPLAIPWMPLAPDAKYLAYDMYTDMADFFRQALPQLGVAVEAPAIDVAHESLAPGAQVALVLKTLPCLEQMDRLASVSLLDRIQAEHIVVSYPAKSLGQRDKGMVAHYEAQFQSLIAGRPWTVQRFLFENELAFLVSKD